MLDPNLVRELQIAYVKAVSSVPIPDEIAWYMNTDSGQKFAAPIPPELWAGYGRG